MQVYKNFSRNHDLKCYFLLVTGYAFNEVLDCPANLVGRVIGRGGETIKSLQVRRIAAEISLPICVF